jgi:hypothetical protein
MPIYKGSDQITKLYHGSTAIGRVYHGSTLVFDSAAGGGGGSEMFSFANDGATFPGYGPSTWPAGIYVSSTDTTWLAREAYLGNTRFTRVTSYDHTAETWDDSNIVFLGTVDDDHGVPALFRDADGRIHAFGGVHNGALKHSATRNADDNSFWNEKATIGSNYTYPHPVFDGTSLYLFLRSTIATVHATGVLLKSTAISSGNITFAAEKTLVDFGSDSRFYLGNTHDDGTYIHLIATRSPGADIYRQDVYHFRYKKSDGSIVNADGTHSVASGSLPINLSDSNTYYRIVDQSTSSHYGGMPSFCADSSGDLHLVYKDGTVGDGSSWDLKHMIYSGGSWGSASTVVSLTNGYRYDMHSVGPLSSGVELLYPEDDGTYARGGVAMKRKVYASGAWGSATTIATDDNGKALDVPSRVLNAHTDLRHHFYEIDQFSTNSGAGGLAGYAYGAGGIAARTIPSNPDGFTWLQLDFTDKADGTTSFDSEGLFYKTLTASGNAQAASGKLELDGTGDFISTPDDNIWSLLDYDFTIDALGVVFDVNNEEQHIISHYNSSVRGWTFNYDGAGHLRFAGSQGGTVHTVQVAFTPTVGSRYDLAAVRSAGTIYFYNGTSLLDSAAFTWTIDNTTPSLVIGSFSGGAAGSFDLNGRMEKIRLRVQTADYTGATRTVPSW